MDAINRISLVFSNVQDLSQRLVSSQKINQYKLNIKKFIIQVQKQVAMLLTNHSQEIQQLKKKLQKVQQQNLQLKQQILRPTITIGKTGRQDMECLSPIRTKTSTLEIGMMTGITKSTNKSKLFSQTAATASFYPQVIGQESPNVTNLHHSRIRNPITKQFPTSIIDSQSTPMIDGRSRFEIQSKQKKIRRQQVIQYLEAQTRNLDDNTLKAMKLLGKFSEPQEDEHQQVKNQLESQVKYKDGELNSSLRAVCQSLDHSFVAQRARAEKISQQVRYARSQQRRKSKSEEEEKFKREKGVKNLLKGLRDGISTHQKSEVVKESRLLNAGVLEKSVRSSKVMVNPLPIQTEKQQRNRNSSLQGVIKINSVLKKSSIFSKQITQTSPMSYKK